MEGEEAVGGGEGGGEGEVVRSGGYYGFCGTEERGLAALEMRPATSLDAGEEDWRERETNAFAKQTSSLDVSLSPRFSYKPPSVHVKFPSENLAAI